MKKNSILIFFFIYLLSHMGITQETVSKVEYYRTSKVVNLKGCDGINTLYFNSQKSLFRHEEYPEKTSYSINGGVTSMVIGDFEKYPIFTDLTTDTVIQKISYMSVETPFRLKDTIEKIDWNIKGVVKNLGGIKCISAEGVYGGREYEVWFSPDIPVPFGPHRLGGLPGLILEARSKDGFVIFEFVQYETEAVSDISINKPINGKLVNWVDIGVETYEKSERGMARDFPPGTAGRHIQDPDVNFEVEKGKYDFMTRFKEWQVQQKKKGK